MLRPDLISEVAREEIGESVSAAHIMLTKNSWFMRVKKARYEIKQILLSHEEVVSRNSFGGISVESVGEIPEEIAAEFYKLHRLEKLCEVIQGRALNAVFNIIDTLNRASVAKRFDTLAIEDALLELLSNAVRHGSVWGEKGCVDVSAERGANGFMMTFEQPLPGPDFPQLYERVCSGYSQFYYRKDKRLGGAGTTMISEKDTPWVWGTPRPGGRFITTFLETRSADQIKEQQRASV
ncbi:MAG: hypothetical protein WCG83_05045 [Candidatus Peregrinibacteria bacterium]